MAQALAANLASLSARALDVLGLIILEGWWVKVERLTHVARARHIVAKGRAGTYALREDLARLGALELVQFSAQRRASGGAKFVRVTNSVAYASMIELHARGQLVALVGRSRPCWGKRGYDEWSTSPIRLENDLRVAALTANARAVNTVMKRAAQCLPQRDLSGLMINALAYDVSRETLATLGAHTQDYLRAAILAAREGLLVLGPALVDAALELDDKKLRLELGRYFVLRGEHERARALDGLPKYGAEGLALLTAFWAGDYEEALRQGDEAVAKMKTRKRKALSQLEGLCHDLAALACSRGEALQLEGLTSRFELVATGVLGERLNHKALLDVQRGLLGQRSSAQPRAQHSTEADSYWTRVWIRALHDVWLELRVNDAPTRSHHRGEHDELPARARAGLLLQRYAQHASAGGFAPVARELEAVHAAYAGCELPSAPSLPRALRPPEAWEAALSGLEALVEHSAAAASVERAPKARELLWELRVGARGVSLLPRSRVRGSKTSGRQLPYQQLRDTDDFELSPADQALMLALERARAQAHYYTASTSDADVLDALIGHPRIVDDEGKPLQIERGQVSLRTTRARGSALRVELEPAQLATSEACYQGPENGRLRIYRRTPELTRAAQIVERGLELPAAAKPRAKRVLARLSAVANVAVTGALEPKLELLDADPRPVLRLRWDGELLAVEARVAPLGLGARQLLPGTGDARMAAELETDGALRMVRCTRDLAEERRRLAQLERACPTLASFELAPHTWEISGLADALEALLELGELGDAVVLAWPEGKALRPPVRAELSQLSVAVSSRDDWFDVDARLRVDEELVLRFGELIAARAGERFVALGEGRFVALSAELRRRLDALASLGGKGKVKGKDKDKDESVAVPAAMLPVLDELADGLERAEFDAAARDRLARMTTLARKAPRKPRSFGASLRDYQREGYAWMWRLAEAGLGACLADDMGLGKTVQTLALLCQRARGGPALVVCPTSVVHNWVAECERFAPRLRPQVLAEADDRQALLDGAGARELIVCSYGLLVFEAEALAGPRFATVVFDEAHALKNAATKRSRAARALTADFRLALTGTPIENRVDELHSLFAVIAPGLLGSKASFDARFTKPIIRGDLEAAARLRAILRHFILRRTKAEVLDELPPRTEITLRISPPAKARAYYEALRQRALATVEAGAPEGTRFRVLAELTRLRQAAVDPRLIDGARAPAGAKIDALVEHVLALREEGHRALVFTQFLTSIALLRAAFTKAGIAHLELEGSTPAAERARRVEAFQAGEGEVFVLSLRAGGVGLNLTGADYVFHLDPWWNPAVEDQATDRAHRMGQSRPVTVYRLVSEGTIEEKILALHEHKRVLADDLVGGLAGAERLELDELVGLLG